MGVGPIERKTAMLTKTIISAALLLSAAAPAIAGQSSQTVGYADLNVSSPAGIAALEGRLQRAVRQVCGSADPTDLGGQSQVRQCRAHAQAGIGPRRDAIRAAAVSPGSGGLAVGGTR